MSEVFEGAGERGDANMAMSVMCKKINQDGKDHPMKERRKTSRELGRANLDFLDGSKK